MDDLRTLLHERTTLTATPSPSLVQDDLARGRTALRRHETRRGARGAVMAVAAAGVVALATQGALGGGASTTASRPAATTAPPAISSAPAVSLVSFTGQQPAGFTIDTVPAGWGVVRSDADGLLLAPAGTGDRNSTDREVSLVDKIAVMQINTAAGMDGTDVSVDVGGAPGTLFTMQDEGPDGKPVASKTKTLYVKQPSDTYLAVQVWDASAWTDAQIAQLGAGIHPTDTATTTTG